MNSSQLDSLLNDADFGDLGELSSHSSTRDALSAGRDLVRDLRGGGAGRSKVGFLSVSARSESSWRDLAAQLGCEVAFLPRLWLDRLAPGAMFASISVRGLGDALDELAQKRGSFDVVLVTGLDLLLSRLDPNDCARFWSDLPLRFPHRPTALILTLPPAFISRFGPDMSVWEKVSARLE